ncbi:SURF1 family protein [Sphingomicrobium nitratireducens]|uniref:SURF1 family protein n=1 Tax=Sphingomicrobium nitratireducens TaxID=2964666 RepID=UPI0022403779|nr:SURF1 family protein [Sphingomicrobium nitratireducens]
MRILTHFVVAGAIAVMIGLGIWQLQRLEWKEGLIASYADAADLPPVPYPKLATVPPLYRKSSVNCLEVIDWRHQAGQNADGQSGYSHVADCRTGAEGPGAAIDIGWSREPEAGTDWTGGAVEGVIGPDEKFGQRLVARDGQAGLEASAPPSPEAMPNNHLAYAVQWFAFALIAAVIYLLALRRRSREEAAP